MKYTVEDLNVALNEGEVVFQFEKKDGTIRTARGTKNFKVMNIDPSTAFSGKEYNKSDAVIRYYDLDKLSWRSFRKEKFITIDKIGKL